MTSAKDQVIRFIQALPGEPTLDDILYHLYVWEEEKTQGGVLVASGAATALPDETATDQPTIQTAPKPR